MKYRVIQNLYCYMKNRVLSKIYSVIWKIVLSKISVLWKIVLSESVKCDYMKYMIYENLILK
jgi:hypothetical protein